MIKDILFVLNVIKNVNFLIENLIMDFIKIVNLLLKTPKELLQLLKVWENL